MTLRSLNSGATPRRTAHSTLSARNRVEISAWAWETGLADHR
ncbi:hypothetical protein AB0D78_06540 [Streptomyces avermitilis]